MSVVMSTGLRRFAVETGRLFAWPGQAVVLPESLAFQSPIDEICARPAPRFLRSTFHLIVALFVALLCLAGVSTVDVVVVARGRLVTASPPVTLQTMDRAMVREIMVHPGDVVKKDQVLATLDPTFADADTASLQKQANALRVQVQRLQAEVEGQTYHAGSAGDQDDGLQEMLDRQRRRELSDRLTTYDQDIERLRAEMRTLNDGRASAARALEIAKSVEQIRATLTKMQVGSKLSLLDAQSSQVRAERDQQEAENKLLEVQHSIGAKVSERDAFVEQWRRDLLETLVSARARLSQVSAELAKASRLHDLVVIKAPADGTILDVAARSQGSVLREAETLLTMIPKGVPLIAEVAIASSDVGFVDHDAETKLKIDAYPSEYNGMLSGRLVSIAEESFSSNASGDGPAGPAAGAMHRARVDLTDTKLLHVPGGARLFPGMTLTAEVKAGSRSLLSYFLIPLTRGLRDAAREP